jgi:hypothetical protein
MANILYGKISFGLGTVAFLLTMAELAILFLLPPATYLFERLFYISFTPLIITSVGLLFYYLQWRSFTTKFINSALIINIITLLVNFYLLYQIKLVI